MTDFTKWLDTDAPEWAFHLFYAWLLLLFCAAVIVSVRLMLTGPRVIVVLLWLVLPVGVVIREYLKARKEPSE